MGMGEPLYNFDNVRDALADRRRWRGSRHLKRRITLSTSGVVPEIPRWPARRSAPCSPSRCTPCATSCATSWCRINRKWPIKDLLDACRAYPGLSNAKRITFEYVMLKGVNDSIADAKELVRLLARHPGQDQSDPVQSLARRALRMLRTGSRSKKFARGGESRRLCEPGAFSARPRHRWPPADG